MQKSKMATTIRHILAYDFVRRVRVIVYFSYIVTVSFIGGGNKGTQIKPPTCPKSLTNLAT